MIRTRRSFFLLIVIALTARISSAQVQTGTPPFGSFGGGPDVINLANLNARLAIPVIHKAGRGTNFAYDLSYDSSVWYPVTSGSTTTWQPVINWGWTGTTPTTTGYASYKLLNTSCRYFDSYLKRYITEYYTQYSNWVYFDSFGISHAMYGGTVQDGGATDCGPPFSSSSHTNDGSGYTMSVDGGPDATLYTKYGATSNLPLQAPGPKAPLTDRNGNQISLSTGGVFTDTLGTTALTVSGMGTPTSPTKLTYAAPSGASPYFQINYTNYTVATNFAVSGINEYKSSAAVPLVSSIVLPDGSQYSIQYESTPSTPAPGACTPYAGTTCVTARVTSITLPTGGSITYAFTGGAGTNNSGIFSDGTTATLTRTTTPGGIWTYAQVKNTGAASTTTITDPSAPANQTVMQFQGIYETQRQVYQGSTSGTLLLTTNTCYNASASPCNSTAITLPIAQRTVIATLPGSNNLQSKHSDFLNTVGMPTETDDYDFGSGAPTSTPLRQVLYAYASLGNITAFKQTVTVKDGAGHTLSQTTYNYDEGTVTASSGTPQHTSVTGSRGNLTSIHYPVGSFTKSFTYYDTGATKTTIDVNGQTTTFNYPDATTTCGNAFPTSVNLPLSLSTSTVWNCTGGVATSATDPNGKITSSSFTDANFWRPASVTDPASAVTSFTYPASSPYNNAESKLLFNSGSSVIDALTTVDGLGRPHVAQIKQGPGATNYDSVETDFDVVGRPSRATMPYSGTAGQTNSSGPATTTTYDALNRPLLITDAGNGTVSYTYAQNDVLVAVGPAPTGENTKQRQLEYDALGRLTSVCEITSAAGSGACSQNATVTGYWTKYTHDALGNLLTVTQNAQAISANQQSRTYAHDAMSRLTSETNPENGTTAYTFDADTTCGTSSGDRVKRLDAQGNTTCYAYDALHRATSITYSGPYAANTPNKYFVYDSATVNSVAMANAKTRLAEAYTCVSPCTTRLTDAGFSYSARGEINDVYESTPHSAGFYHVNALYWESGARKQFSGLPGLPTISSAPDAQGRPNTVTASSGQNPVASTTYSPYAAPQLTVNFGSGDSDVFTADTSTGRLTQYKFKIGATQSLTGNLTWNANGSLQQQTITDNFNAADTQTCNYAYDDISRLASGNCGSAASQTFSYDPFGNINKSGSPFSFQPTYSNATNRMTSLPGNFTPTYDNNGNVLNDSAHQYAPDAENRPVTTDGVALTYDALGRMVEQNRSNVYTQIVYGPSGGKLALMSGQTLQKAFVALPGGAQAVYNSSGLLYYGHSDHLGSARLGSTTTRTVSWDLAYAPFSEPYAQFGTPDLSFTGQRQDSSAGLSDFPAREYSNQGRWPSPDPAGLAAANLSVPQTWNRYAYVANNPLSRTDPLGEFFVDCSWDYCGGGPWGGGGGGVYVDGALQTVMTGLGGNGLAACPNNVCNGFTSNGDYFQFVAGAGGASGYVKFSDITSGMNEWNGTFYSDSQWGTFLTDRREALRETLADAISWASNDSNVTWDFVYNHLVDNGTQGGNADFGWDNSDGTSVVGLNLSIPGAATGGCEWSCRDGSMPSLHYNNFMFHLDTANPSWGFGLGLFIHGFVDVLLGNINPSVPMLH
jgi:RHS repeat-associated protein